MEGIPRAGGPPPMGQPESHLKGCHRCTERRLCVTARPAETTDSREGGSAGEAGNVRYA